MRKGRTLSIGLVVAVFVAIAVVFAWHAALDTVRERIAAALGPGTRVAAIDVGLTGIEIRDISVPGGEGWPVARALEAERVRIVPALRTALSKTIVIRSVAIEKPYVSAVRTNDGRLVFLPTILGASAGEKSEPASDTPAEAGRSVRIASVSIDGGEIELFDRSVGRNPWRLHLGDVRASVQDIEAPALSSRMPFDISGTVDGPQRDGSVAVNGWFEGSTQDLKAEAALRQVDLLALEPYLVHNAHVRLSRGTFDLSMDASVHSRRLRAPGHLALADLAFKPGSRPTDIVLGVPRDVLIKAMAARDGRIALDFTLEGDVDDPRFSLNEAFAQKIAVATANTLGITVGGLVKDVGEIGAQGLSGAGKAAKDIGGKLKGLLRPNR